VRALRAALTAARVPVKASAASPPAAVPLLKVTLALLLRARLPPATARVTCVCVHSVSSSDSAGTVSSQASAASSRYCCYCKILLTAARTMQHLSMKKLCYATTKLIKIVTAM
jgi:hypothetical protein